MYSKYHNCDPSLQKRISSPDMLMPLYVMDTMSDMPGLPGLFIAGNIFLMCDVFLLNTLVQYLKSSCRDYSYRNKNDYDI